MNTLENSVVEFNSKYNLKNQVSLYNAIEGIKEQSKTLDKQSLKEYIKTAKSQLESDFENNIDKVAKDMDFDLNVYIDNPFKESAQIFLRDLIILQYIALFNRVTMKSFEESSQTIIDAL